MKNKYSWILCLGMFTFFISCNSHQTFNKEQWLKKELDWQIKDTRERMINDLLTHYLKEGSTKPQVIELLGPPDKEYKNQLLYLVREKYSWDIDPEYISYLVIELDSSAKLEKVGVQRNVWRKLHP